MPRLLFFRPARRPVYPVDAATQPHLILRRAHGVLRRLLQSLVLRLYAGDGSPRLEGCSPQPGYESLRFKRPSTGNGSLRFERRHPQRRNYLGDESLPLGHRSSQPRNGSPRTKHRAPQPRAAQ